MRTIRLLIAFVSLATTAAQWVPCGCSWSARGGCGISTEQLLHVLSDSKVDHLCQATNNLGNESMTSEDVLQDEKHKSTAALLAKYECEFRDKIHQYTDKMKVCPKLSSRRCAESKYCEYGSQQFGRCGIDEEKLVMDLVGDYNQNHPLVQFIVNSNDCRERGEQQCEINPRCEWRSYMGCDMKELDFYKTILVHPKILRLLEYLKESSFCHAYYERHNMCLHYSCRFEYGICRYNFTRHQEHPAEDMFHLVENLCHRMSAGDCVSPCVNSSQGGSNFCRAPSSLPDEFYKPDMDRNDWYVYGLMLQLNSGTYLNERFCNYMDSNQTQCMQSDRVCDGTNEYRRPTFREHTHPVDSKPVSGIDKDDKSDSHLAVGMDGVLGQLVNAVSNGKVGEKFNKYIEDNPHALETVGDEVAHLWHRQPETSPPTTLPPVAATATPAPQLVSDTTMIVIGVLPVVLLAALCAGIATGTTCTMTLWRRHQPRLLLPEDTMVDYEVAPEIRRRSNQ
mmetsp:Transcript_39383/g.71687  ORF Transcript_39383/g.71687 Transcript_39383/m.71687 type:complete len:507 (+) Transcript_39383:76-1596(+)